MGEPSYSKRRTFKFLDFVKPDDYIFFSDPDEIMSRASFKF